MSDIRKLFVRSSSKIREVMENMGRAALAKLPSGIALILESDGTLMGVVTDGDIRRGLLAGYLLDDPVERIMIRDPIVFSSDMSYREILNDIPKRITEKGRYRGGVLEKVIIVNKENRVVEVLDFIDLWNRQSMVHRKICIVGMGYVGLTLAVSLAEVGFRVIGTETDSKIHNMLKTGKPHFHEVGLEPLLRHHLGRRLAIEGKVSYDSEVYIITIGTRVGADNVLDSNLIQVAAEDVGRVLKYGSLVIVRSTVSFGISRNVVLPTLERTSGLKCGRDFYLTVAPERTIEGKALIELRSLPQVIGGFDKNSTDLTVNLFRELTPSIVTVGSLEEAEMVKLVNNSFRDLNFAFANELTLICNNFNLNAYQIIKAANEGYPRSDIPMPSPGVGGSCLKKDPYMFIDMAHITGIKPCLSDLGRVINEKMPGFIIQKVIKAMEDIGKKMAESTIFIIGFAFKGEPETSDMRESTTLDVLKLLKPYGSKIRGYDPVVPAIEIEKLGVKPCSIEEGFIDADCAIVMNNHRSYSNIDIYSCLSSMNKPAVYYDGWNIFSPKEIKQIEDITYVGLSFTV